MKPSMIHNSGVSLLMILAAGILLFEATTTYAAPHSSSYPGYYSPLSMEGQNPEYLLQTIARLRQALIADDDLENSEEDMRVSKRFVSFGVDRGSSGKVENLTRCLAFRASSPCGPGRRKRVTYNCYQKRRFTCMDSKRGLDLGLGRGFSGSQAAKHLMGLAAANFAGGPGRRRRSEEEA